MSWDGRTNDGATALVWARRYARAAVALATRGAAQGRRARRDRAAELLYQALGRELGRD